MGSEICIGDKRWSVWTEAASANYHANIAPPPFGGKGTDMARAMQWLRERLPQNSILTNGTGNYAAQLHRFYQCGLLAAGLRMQLVPTSGAMDYGASAAVATKIVCPDTPVICMAGDGCFLVNGQELATAMQYNAPVIFIVTDNGMYGTIRMHQEHEYPEHVSGTELCNPDFTALARTYDVEGHTVHSSEDFQSAVEAALAAGVATITEVQTDPNITGPRATIDSPRAQSRS